MLPPSKTESELLAPFIRMALFCFNELEFLLSSTSTCLLALLNRELLAKSYSPLLLTVICGAGIIAIEIALLGLIIPFSLSLLAGDDLDSSSAALGGDLLLESGLCCCA